MSRTLSTVDKGKPKDWLHVAIQRLATQAEYDDLRIRDYLEQQASREFVQFLHETYLSMIDSPVGRWELQFSVDPVDPDNETEEPFVLRTWAYRLHGYAKAKEAQ